MISKNITKAMINLTKFFMTVFKELVRNVSYILTPLEIFFLTSLGAG